MTAKRMLSLRLPPPLADRIDRLAEAEGITRTEWCAQALARQAVRASGSSAAPEIIRIPREQLDEIRPVTGSGRPQPGDAPGDDV